MALVTVAIQPFNGLQRDEVEPIAGGIRSIYAVETVILEPIGDSGFVYGGFYVHGPPTEELVDKLRGIHGHKYRLGIGREVRDGSAFSDDCGEMTIAMTYLPPPMYATNRFWVERSKRMAAHEVGHALGMDHCWENGGPADEKCIMSVIKVSTPLRKLCKKHAQYLRERGLLR